MTPDQRLALAERRLETGYRWLVLSLVCICIGLAILIRFTEAP